MITVILSLGEAMDSSDFRRGEVASEIVAVCRELAGTYVIGTGGNVSARCDDGSVLVTPSGAEFATIQAGDLVRVDLTSGDVLGSGVPTSESALHLGLLRTMRDINAVVHTHSKFATAFAVARVDVPFVCNESLSIRASTIRVTDFAPAGSQELADACLRTFGREPVPRAVILANHGPIAIGTTVAEAEDTAINVEWVCDVYYKALVIGQPVLLSREEQAALAANYGIPGFEVEPTD